MSNQTEEERVKLWEPEHNKTNKMTCTSSEYSDQPGHPHNLIRVSLSAWRRFGFLATPKAHSEYAYQAGWIPRLIWVFAARTVVSLLVLSCYGSILKSLYPIVKNLRRMGRYNVLKKYEPRHDKTNKVNVRPANTQISLGIRPVWSESSLSAWRKLGSLATH